MYPIRRNLNRCRTRLRDLQKVSMDLTDNPLNFQIYYCEKELGNIDKARMITNVKNVCIIHLQQMMVVAAYNLLLKEEDKEEEQVKLNTDPVTTLEVIDQLNWIIASQIYVDLIERIEMLEGNSKEGTFREFALIDLQRETLDRILKELHYLARNKIKKEPE